MFSAKNFIREMQQIPIEHRPEDLGEFLMELVTESFVKLAANDCGVFVQDSSGNLLRFPVRTSMQRSIELSQLNLLDCLAATSDLVCLNEMDETNQKHIHNLYEMMPTLPYQFMNEPAILYTSSYTSTGFCVYGSMYYRVEFYNTKLSEYDAFVLPEKYTPEFVQRETHIFHYTSYWYTARETLDKFMIEFHS